MDKQAIKTTIRMTLRSVLAVSALGLVASACVIEEEPAEDTDQGETSTGDGDPSTGDGDGDPSTGDGDGDGDPTTGDGDGDGDPTTGDGDGDGDMMVDCDNPDGPLAELRFMDLVGTVNPSLFDSLHVDSLCRVQADLYEGHGTPYMQVLSTGQTQFTITDSVSEDVLAGMTDVYLEEGKRYSVVFTPGNEIMLVEDDYANIPADQTRVRVFNADPADASHSWIGYWNGEGYPVDYVFDLEARGDWTQELPMALAPVQLEFVWAAQDNLLVDWNVAAVVQETPGSLMNVYVWKDGDCSYGSQTCSPQLKAQREDGSTFTVEGGTAGWAP